MASLIPGFEYDVFISYRQKDNKHDGWVTEFVNNLKGELESTFKEEISVYFDINPHDGLLETHDVDASLKDKLKCLIFIPIISRTYCDPKSFAWEHEFKAFVELASKDQFGLKVKLPNGNVASRVLPIRIHDLDNDDIRLCESVLGGVLRGVEFIYKEPGINKPLSPEDDEKKNLNGTKYRLQINKTANAIKEIIAGLKTGPVGSGGEKIQLKLAEEEINRDTSIEEHGKPLKLLVIKLLSGFLITVILVVAAILAYPKIFKRNTLENLRLSGERISVAVMPFRNMTNDTIWNVWQEIIQSNLITSLSNNPDELKIRQSESIIGLIQSKGLTNYVSLTPSVASTVSKKLDADIFIYGDIIKSGNVIRLSAQLIDTKTGEIIKPFKIEGSSKEEYILNTIDSLSLLITNYLLLSKLAKELSPDICSITATRSPEAYRDYIYGLRAFVKLDYPNAIKLSLQSVSKDSNLIGPYITLIDAYRNQGMYDQAKKWCLKVYKKKDKFPRQYQPWLDQSYAHLFETPEQAIVACRQGLELDDQQPLMYYQIGDYYNWLYQYDRAIPELEKGLDIYKKWGVKPIWFGSYTALGLAYH
jgi:TolB-like protein